MNYKFFETDRLIIRPTYIEDAEFIFELLNTKNWIEYIDDRNVRSIEDAEEYIKNRRNSRKIIAYSSYQTMYLTEILALRNRLLAIYLPLGTSKDD
jgi:hypothetical protein